MLQYRMMCEYEIKICFTFFVFLNFQKLLEQQTTEIGNQHLGYGFSMVYSQSGILFKMIMETPGLRTSLKTKLNGGNPPPPYKLRHGSVTAKCLYQNVWQINMINCNEGRGGRVFLYLVIQTYRWNG